MILLPISAVREDIVTSFRLFCLRWFAGKELSLGLRPFMSKGPGAIVFILCRSPPLVAVLGLTGANIGSIGAGFRADPP
jgi:hypothetical protein